MNSSLKNNNWKMFIYSLSQRRHFIPILSIFFLTLPNTNAQQIGLYSGLGFLASFLFEIPSGYFSDTFGHKRTLILAKISMIFSMLLFIVADNLYYFIFGSIFLSISTAFDSGTKNAFVYETLLRLNKEKDYSKIMGKMSANVSIISMFLIISLPFFTKINLILPLKINLIFDIIGLLVVISLVNPRIKKERTIENKKSILQLFKESKKQKFFSVAIFTGAITGFITSESAFRVVYLETLGYPVVFLGFVMGLSRLIWFIVGHYAHYIEKYITIKKLFFIEIFIFTGYYFLVASLSNPYLVGFIFSLVVGYQWGRTSLLDQYLLDKYIHDKNYKATLLSVRSQVTAFFQVSLSFLIGFVMNYSYKLGFYILGIILFIVLVFSYQFIKKHD